MIFIDDIKYFFYILLEKEEVRNNKNYIEKVYRRSCSVYARNFDHLLRLKSPFLIHCQSALQIVNTLYSFNPRDSVVITDRFVNRVIYNTPFVQSNMPGIVNEHRRK